MELDAAAAGTTLLVTSVALLFTEDFAGVRGGVDKAAISSSLSNCWISCTLILRLVGGRALAAEEEEEDTLAATGRLA